MTEVLRAQIKEKLMASNLCSDDGGAPVKSEPNQAVVASMVTVAAVRLGNLVTARRAVSLSCSCMNVFFYSLALDSFYEFLYACFPLSLPLFPALRAQIVPEPYQWTSQK